MMYGTLLEILNEDKITGRQIHDFFKYICPTLYPFLVGVISIDMIKRNVQKLKKCHFLVFNESVRTSPGVTVLEKNTKNSISAEVYSFCLISKVKDLLKLSTQHWRPLAERITTKHKKIHFRFKINCISGLFQN